jgi:hypothetical protein
MATPARRGDWLLTSSILSDWRFRRGLAAPRAILANYDVLRGWIGSSSRLSGRGGSLRKLALWAGTLGGWSGGGEDEHPLEVPGHGHEAPLGAHFVETAQRKLAESERWQSVCAAYVHFLCLAPPKIGLKTWVFSASDKMRFSDWVGTPAHWRIALAMRMCLPIGLQTGGDNCANRGGDDS